MLTLPRAETVTPTGSRRTWDELAARSSPSWYLDSEVALQKRQVHQALIRKWVGNKPSGRVLKTDLFEDAWGLDAIIVDLFEPGGATLLGTDIALATVRAARARAGTYPLHCFVCDVQRLPIASASLDIVLSTSTLDHFDSRAEFECAIFQLCAALKPGGSLVITLDNPLNPLYSVLRLAARTGLVPFPLGYTPTIGALVRDLRERGFEILDRDWMIHNPRILSTALIWLVRRTCGRLASVPIRWLLRLFALQDRLWTRRFTACFYAVYARKTLSSHGQNELAESSRQM